MSRKPRDVFTDDHMHTVFRVTNREFLFTEDSHHHLFLETLRRQQERYGARVFAWTGMSNHHHIFNDMPRHWHCETAFARRQQRLHVPVRVGDMLRDSFSDYAKRFNCLFGREGALIRDRTKTVRILSDRHALALLAYIFLNPVRAGIVSDPAEYPYSNFRQYAFGGEAHGPCRFDFHPSYLALGNSASLRCTRFRRLVASAQRGWGRSRWSAASGTHGGGRNRALNSINEFLAVTDHWFENDLENCEGSSTQDPNQTSI